MLSLKTPLVLVSFLFIPFALVITEIDVESKLKYISYLPFLTSIFIGLFYRNNKAVSRIKDYNKTTDIYLIYLKELIYLYIIIVLYSLLILLFRNGVIFERNYAYMFFLLAPILTVYFVVKDMKEPNNITIFIDYIFYGYIIVFIVHITTIGIEFNDFENAMLTSDIKSESAISFEMAFFSFFYFLQKDKKKFFISFIIMFLTFKRLAVSSFLIVFLLYYFPKRILLSGTIVKITITILVISIILFFFKLSEGFFDQDILYYTGKTTNDFFKGRLSFYNTIINYYSYLQFQGLGLGETERMLYKAYGIRHNMHSEILRAFFEFGIVFFIVWIYLLFKATFRSKNTLLFVVLFILMNITDNLFTYYRVMIIYYLMITYMIYYNKAQLTYEKKIN